MESRHQLCSGLSPFLGVRVVAPEGLAGTGRLGLPPPAGRRCSAIPKLAPAGISPPRDKRSTVAKKAPHKNKCLENV